MDTQFVRVSFNGGEVTDLLSARVDIPSYNSWCSEMKNMVCLQTGPATRRPGTQFLGIAKDQDVNNPVILVPFIFSALEARVLEFGVGYIRVWLDGSLVQKEGAIYEVVTEYTANDIRGLRFAQSADLIFIASENHPPKKLGRYADDDWRIRTIDFVPKTASPSGLQAQSIIVEGAQGKRDYEYVVTAIDNVTGEESLPSAPVTLVDAKNMSSLAYNKLTWTAALGDILEYRIYRKIAGVFGFVGRVSATNTLTFQDDNVRPDTEDTPPTGENPFDAEGKYPSIVGYWQQRIMWASSKNRPMTIWGSPSGQFESMAAGVPPADSDAVEITLATPQANRIMWLEGERTLCMGTVGDEWNIGKADEAFTPSSSFSKQGGRGSSFIPALFAGSSILFVQRGGETVREFAYEYASDKYQSADLTLLASHMFEGENITGWAYQQSDAPIVWAVLESGQLRGMTYDKEQSVIAWHKHETDGKVESICSVPHDEGDEIYLSVVREINGQNVRYIEKLGEFFLKSNDPASATMVDSFKKYCSDDGQETLINITGLEHLEGTSVLVWEDSAQQGPFTVLNGEIALSHPVKCATVGIPYESIIKPFRPEIVAPDGTTLMRKYGVKDASLRLYKTMGGKVGSSLEELEDILKHNSNNPLKPEYREKVDKEITVASGFEEDWNFVIIASGAAPMTVQAITYSIDVGD